MALLSCPECLHEISSLALACPQCAYPYPGKQGVTREKLVACVECGGIVSKKAKLCPHCGISCIDNIDDIPVAKDESWLCTHCGTPYTRKAQPLTAGHLSTEDRHSIDQNPQGTEEQDNQKPAIRHSNSEHPPSDDQKPPFIEGRDISILQKMGSAAPSAGRHASPLWFPSSPPQELDSSSSRQRKKTTIIVGIMLALILTLSIMLWVLGEFNGTNPFDALASSTWLWPDSLPTAPTEGP